jgi:hypothetical protein
MDMQMRNGVADHGRVYMLGTRGRTQGLAGPGAPPADGSRFVVGEVGQAGRVPPRLDKQVSQVGWPAGAARRGGR